MQLVLDLGPRHALSQELGPTLSQIWAKKREENGLTGKDGIRETFTPLILGDVRLEDLTFYQKRYEDFLMLTSCYVLKPSMRAALRSPWGTEESSRLLREYEFGVKELFCLARTPEGKARIEKARLAPRTWFKQLAHCADHMKWENGYYGTHPNPYSCTSTHGCSVLVMEGILPLEARLGLLREQV